MKSRAIEASHPLACITTRGLLCFTNLLTVSAACRPNTTRLRSEIARKMLALCAEAHLASPEAKKSRTTVQPVFYTSRESRPCCSALWARLELRHVHTSKSLCCLWDAWKALRESQEASGPIKVDVILFGPTPRSSRTSIVMVGLICAKCPW